MFPFFNSDIYNVVIVIYNSSSVIFNVAIVIYKTPLVTFNGIRNSCNKKGNSNRVPFLVKYFYNALLSLNQYLVRFTKKNITGTITKVNMVA